MALIQKSFSDIITFSRSSNATRVGPTGVLEYAPHNLLQRSQEFDNAYWTKYDATVSINAVSGPDGTVTADKFIEANGAGIFPQSYVIPVLSNATVYTLSIYAKAAERNWIIVNLNDGLSSYRTWFNVSSGVIGTNAAGNTATVTSVGNGWYRCTVSRITSASSGANALIGFQVSNADGVQAYTGDGTSGIYIWGAQLSVGPYALDYTPTTSAAVYGPRFDYDPVTLAARGLLVEESRTNLVTYSEQFDNAAWAKLNTTATANAAVSPDGTVTADKLVSSGSSTKVIYQAISSAGTYAISIYAKAGEYSGLTFTTGIAGTFFNLATGTVRAYYSAVPTSSTITPVGNGWYRCTIVVTLAAADNLYIGPNDNVNNTLGSGWTADGASGIYVWGAQVESGTFSTSYIPTLASTVTRSADVASVNTLSPWFNATEGTFLFDFNQVATVKAIAVIGDDTFDNSLRFNIVEMARGVGPGFANIVELGTAQNGSHKLAVAIKLNDYAGVFDGGAVSTETSASLVPSPNVLGIGRDYGTNGYMNGWMRRLAFYPRRLTNAELQALTA